MHYGSLCIIFLNIILFLQVISILKLSVNLHLGIGTQILSRNTLRAAQVENQSVKR